MSKDLIKSDFDRILEELHTPKIAQKLNDSVVGIAGLGGVGSNVANLLCRCGIGKLIIADFDRVELRNLTRQHYFINQLGQNKVEALYHNLKMANPLIDVDYHVVRLTSDNILDIFDDCQVVIETFDNTESKVMIIETILHKAPDKYIVATSGVGGYGKSEDIHIRRCGKLFICGDEITEVRSGVPLLCARVSIVASIQANTTIEIIIDEINGGD